MKKISSSIALIAISSALWAQAPKIDGTYLPVAGTVIKQVYDTTAAMLDVPSLGINQVWDYSNKFVNASDTFLIRTLHPDSTGYGGDATGANFATFLRVPFPEGDSIISFYKVTRKGVYIVGGFYAQAEYDTTYQSSKNELVLPFEITSGHVGHDTSRIYAYLNYSGVQIKAVKSKVKKLEALGYGTLSTPLGTFKDVLLGKETVMEIDSIYVKSGNNYIFNSTLFPVKTNHFSRYHFLRNNTFATSELMMLQADTAGTQVKFGWYTLPSDFGHIMGMIKDSIGNAVSGGWAYLYRENSNFTKDDILAKASVDSTGHYSFDTIPYGQYRICVKPDTILHPTGLVAYYGDSAKWNAAKLLSTSKDTLGVDIKMQFHPPLNGNGKISGNLSINWNLYTANKMKMFAGDPIPGIDIIVEKTPGGIAVSGQTNSDGDFSFDGLTDGNYELFVGVPGLEMTGTYSFSILGSTIVNDLDFTLGADSVYPNDVLTGIKNFKVNNPSSALFAYPNPYKGYTNIKVNMDKKGELLLEVYNLVGEKIATIDQSEKEQGEYAYKFSAKELGFAAGMYMIKLTTFDETMMLKVVEQ